MYLHKPIIDFKLLIKTISGNLLNRMFGESNSWTNIRLRQFYVKMAKIVKKSMSAEIGHLFTISHSRSSWTTEWDSSPTSNTPLSQLFQKTQLKMELMNSCNSKLEIIINLTPNVIKPWSGSSNKCQKLQANQPQWRNMESNASLESKKLITTWRKQYQSRQILMP